MAARRWRKRGTAKLGANRVSDRHRHLAKRCLALVLFLLLVGGGGLAGRLDGVPGLDFGSLASRQSLGDF